MAEADGLTGGNRWAGLLSARHLFQLARLRSGAFHSAAGVPTLAQWTTFVI